MRAYVGVTAQEVKDFLESEILDVSDVYAATGVFMAHNNELEEEEIEYTLSLVAAEMPSNLYLQHRAAPVSWHLKYLMR
jgi:cytosine/adenosine deaminase-related metal-dependent hydrolase